jgi:zinc transporter 1
LRELRHQGHAHARLLDGGRKAGRDLNILGILVHIGGDAINSVAVSEWSSAASESSETLSTLLLIRPPSPITVISAGIFLATKFVYADPIASMLVGFMIIGTATPLTWKSGKYLMHGVPQEIDTNGVREDIERITGANTVHELHIWNLSRSACLECARYSELGLTLPFLTAQRKTVASLHLT